MKVLWAIFCFLGEPVFSPVGIYTYISSKRAICHPAILQQDPPKEEDSREGSHRVCSWQVKNAYLSTVMGPNNGRYGSFAATFASGFAKFVAPDTLKTLDFLKKITCGNWKTDWKKKITNHQPPTS